jgi:hypothetical protein
MKTYSELNRDEIEHLAEAVHRAYCRYYQETHDGKEYWTNGDYSLLDETTKEIDRQTVKAVFMAMDEYVPEKTCGNCEHWGKEYPYKIENRDRCKKLEQFDEGCGGDIIIATPEDFCCSLHERTKEVKD